MPFFVANHDFMNKRLPFLTLTVLIASVFNATVASAAISKQSLDAVTAAEKGAATFSDVNAGTRYFMGVPYVVTRGFMKGNEDGSFGLEKTETRLEALYAIMKAVNPKIDQMSASSESKSIFRDVRKNSYAYEAVNEAYENGVLESLNLRKNYLKPTAPVTTGEVLHMYNSALHRDANAALIELKYELKTTLPDDWAYTNDVRLALSEGVLIQKADGTLAIDPTQKLSRGDFAVLMYRLAATRTEGTRFGLASWYGDGLSKVKVDGDRGKALAAQGLTAANRTLPMGTILRVTNELNGKSVEVVVNDRGPYIAGRIVDLSRSAFSAIENVGAGTASVKIEIVNEIE